MGIGPKGGIRPDIEIGLKGSFIYLVMGEKWDHHHF